MSTTFANSINSNPIYADRAEKDAAGNTIATTYATKSELPDGVPAVTSSDDGKVLKASYTGGTGSFSWETESGGGGTQADWTEDDPVDPSYIQNKPTIVGISAGSNVSITEANNTLTIAATDTTYTAGNGISISNGAISNSDPLPAHTSTESGKVLGVDSNGDLGWVTVPVPQFNLFSDIGKVLMVTGNGPMWMNSADDPYNPLNLPQFTIRARFAVGYTPSMGSSQTLVDAATNTWDINEHHGNIANLFTENTSLIEILGANTTGALSVSNMFKNCTSLQRVAVFDTRDFGDFSEMFRGCTSLLSVPPFNMSGTASGPFAFVVRMFQGCTAVESGALELYNHLASVFPAGGYHDNCFTNCGSGTVTGAQDLASIPTSWGGTLVSTDPGGEEVEFN